MNDIKRKIEEAIAKYTSELTEVSYDTGWGYGMDFGTCDGDPFSEGDPYSEGLISVTSDERIEKAREEVLNEILALIERRIKNER